MRAAILLTLVLTARVALAESLALVGGTIHPVTDAPYVGTVIVRDGRIAAAGVDVSVPDDAESIDADGLHVFPGFMDAMSQLGLLEIGSVSATDDRGEMGLYNPHLRAATAIHPDSDLIPVARETGITHSLVAPVGEDDGVLTGQAALVQLDGWTVEEMALDDSVAMVLFWPPVVTRRFDFATFSWKDSAFEEAKETAQEQRRELADWLEAARHYAQAMAVEQPRTTRELKLEALARVLDGKQRVIVVADKKRDIESAVEFAESEGLDIILARARDAWMVKEMLVEKSIPVILGPAQVTPQEQDDPYDRPYALAGELASAGVKIAFGSGAGRGWGTRGVHAARTLPFEANTAVAFGLSEEDALKSLTLWPAEMLGVADRLGSIEPGKIANLVVSDGDPLSVHSQLRHLIVGGHEVTTDNVHRQLYERYRARPADR